MEHPFMPNISELSLEEIQKKIQQLNSNLNFASRTGKTFMVNQIQMVLEGYNTVYAKKMDEIYKKQNIQNNININNTK